MPCMGPGSPSDEFVDEALQKVLDLLGEDYHCFIDPPSKIPTMAMERQKRVLALKQAIHDMIELEYWESF